MRIRRLLVLLPGESFGAAESQAFRLCLAAGGTGVSVTVAAEGAVLARLREAARDGAPALLDLPVGWRNGPESAAGQAEATRAALAACQADAVFLALPTPGHAPGAMPVLAEAGMPTLAIIHAAARLPTPGGARLPELDAATMAAAGTMRAEWVAVSTPVAERSARWLGLAEGSVATIPDAVDRPGPMDREACRAALREALGIDPGVPVALFLGRLDAAAGADHLPALAEAFGTRTGGLLACSGEGILEAALREAGGAAKPLRLLEAGQNPAALLAGADLLVLPSRTEGAPLGFLAAAWGCVPVVASPQALEAIGEDAAEVAALADPDDPEAMAEAMAESLDPSGPAPARAAAARRLTEAWRPEDMVERCLGRLRRLAAFGNAGDAHPSPHEPVPLGEQIPEVPAP